MTQSECVAAEGTSTCSAAFLERIGGIDLAPYLATLDDAKPGDLVCMVSFLEASTEVFPSHKHFIEAFYVMGEAGLEIRFYDELSGVSAGHAAHLVTNELFMGSDLHQIVCSFDMVEMFEFYTLCTVHFADAVLYFNRAWLEGNFGMLDDDISKIHPVVVKMGAVSDVPSAEACVTKTRRYLDVVRSMLPAQKRNKTDWSITLPAPEMFLT